MTEVIGLHISIFVYLLTSWGMYISVVFRNCQETDLVFEIDFLQATVGLALFGKQTLVDLDVNEIVLETK